MVQTMSRTRSKPSPSRRSGKLPNFSPQYEADIFKGIEFTELAQLLNHLKPLTCPAGTIIFAPEDIGERLYILRQGRVDLYRLTADGKRVVIRRILPGSVFGVMGFLGQTAQGDFAEATEDSDVCVVSREDILALLKRRPEVMLRVLEMVGNRLRLLEERFMQAVCSPVTARLAHFLLTNADSASGELSNLTHEEIGGLTGAVRQTVTETLSLFRKQGLVLTGPKQIRIIDRHGLEEISRGFSECMLLFL